MLGIMNSLLCYTFHSDSTCAIIARSAGIFQNKKKFCTCDGVSQWDEALRMKL